MFNDAPAMLIDFWLNHRATMTLQTFVGAFLVDTHQTAVSGNIRRQNSCEPPFHIPTAPQARFDQFQQLRV